MGIFIILYLQQIFYHTSRYCTLKYILFYEDCFFCILIYFPILSHSSLQMLYTILYVSARIYQMLIVLLHLFRKLSSICELISYSISQRRKIQSKRSSFHRHYSLLTNIQINNKNLVSHRLKASQARNNIFKNQYHMFSVKRPRGKYTKSGKNSLRIDTVKFVSLTDVKNRPRCQEKATAFIEAFNFAIGRDCRVRYKKKFIYEV